MSEDDGSGARTPGSTMNENSPVIRRKSSLDSREDRRLTAIGE
jgi:hypothetical protein